MHVLMTMLLAVSVSVPVSAEEVDRDQFARLVNTLFSNIHDVTFVYEGEITFHDRAEDNAEKFQGLYSFREDGATLLDVYHRPASHDRPMSRSIDAMIHDKHERVGQAADQGFSQLSISASAPGVMHMPTSPERILYLYYFKGIGDLSDYYYDFLGFVERNGRRCMHVQLSLLPHEDTLQMGDNALFAQFWIDAERGGHPIEVEIYRGMALQTRSVITNVRKFDLGDGKAAWLPVSGRLEQFVSLDRLRGAEVDEPVVTETYFVVDGSVQFNRSLSDSYFTALRKDAYFHDATLRSHQQALDLDSERRPIFRTDPASVQRRLDEQLAIEDRQAKRLDASRPTQRWTWMMIASFGLGIAGVVTIAGVIYGKLHPA